MPLNETQSDAILATVREVSAAEITPRFRNLNAVDIDQKSTFDDLVTVADKAAEDALTARLQKILPGDTIIGEEAVSADQTLLDRVGHGRVAVIDPIDGTWNYAHGVATYGVILAVIEDGQTVWGLLYDPSFDDWVVAGQGGGAWFHRGGGKRRLSTETAPRPFAELRGNVGAYMFDGAAKARLSTMTGQFRRARSLGASVHEYRQMALAASDFCLNGMLNVWDHAAGELVLREAGGCSRLLDGQAYAPTMRSGYLLNARSEALWEELAEMFQGAFT